MKEKPPISNNAQPADSTNDSKGSDSTLEGEAELTIARAASMSRIVATAGQPHFAQAVNSGGLLLPHAKHDQTYAGMRANVMSAASQHPPRRKRGIRPAGRRRKLVDSSAIRLAVAGYHAG